MALHSQQQLARGAGRGTSNCSRRTFALRHAPVRVSAVAAPTVVSTSAAPLSVQLEDKFLAKNIPSLVSQQSAANESLQALRDSTWKALPSLRMPTTRNEEYRFTDISPLLRTELAAADATASVSKEFVASLIPEECATSHIVIVNGTLRPELSNLSGLPAGVYVGGAAGAPAEALKKLGGLSAERGGPFSVINGALARDVLVVSLPADSTMTSPLYVLNITSTATSPDSPAPVSAPRMLVHAGSGALGSLVEEWVGAAPAAPAPAAGANTCDGFTCPVCEIFLEKNAQVSHGYVVREAPGTAHMKATLVQQEESSSYTLTEARLGGALTRHDVGITQAGPETNTDMGHFILAGPNQLHDLHTKLALDHPEGAADQLHKCIVTAPSARGVFDGNVRVGRLAQRTDAGQLSRNLLLAPRATVNVKPNLQIIADDVKCTHGCAVSNLSEEELFYFRTRGISALAARQALVASFGAEVTQRLKLPALQKRMQADVNSKLQGIDFSSLEA